MLNLPGNLTVHRVKVSRNATDSTVLDVAATDGPHARALAIGIVRQRASLPSSVTLFAEVVA